MKFWFFVSFSFYLPKRDWSKASYRDDDTQRIKHHSDIMCGMKISFRISVEFLVFSSSNDIEKISLYVSVSLSNHNFMSLCNFASWVSDARNRIWHIPKDILFNAFVPSGRYNLSKLFDVKLYSTSKNKGKQRIVRYHPWDDWRRILIINRQVNINYCFWRVVRVWYG